MKTEAKIFPRSSSLSGSLDSTWMEDEELAGKQAGRSEAHGGKL